MSESETPSQEHRTPEELIDYWRRLSNQRGIHQSRGFNARCEIYRKCAAELERALEAEESQDGFTEEGVRGE